MHTLMGVTSSAPSGIDWALVGKLLVIVLGCIVPIAGIWIAALKLALDRVDRANDRTLKEKSDAHTEALKARDAAHYKELERLGEVNAAEIRKTEAHFKSELQRERDRLNTQWAVEIQAAKTRIRYIDRILPQEREAHEEQLKIYDINVKDLAEIDWDVDHRGGGFPKDEKVWKLWYEATEEGATKKANRNGLVKAYQNSRYGLLCEWDTLVQKIETMNDAMTRAGGVPLANDKDLPVRPAE
ncbi:MAG: hypothetical protein FD180_3195 [Planctomycetota bacterium]|nr:MAG: hypothetical protein FD180_3195 [Planctomycetota bacterium]